MLELEEDLLFMIIELAAVALAFVGIVITVIYRVLKEPKNKQKYNAAETKKDIK